MGLHSLSCGYWGSEFWFSCCCDRYFTNSHVPSLFLWNKVSFCSSGWPGTHYKAKTHGFSFLPLLPEKQTHDRCNVSHLAFFFFPFFLKAVLLLHQATVLNLSPSYLSTGITGMCHHTQLCSSLHAVSVFPPIVLNIYGFQCLSCCCHSHNCPHMVGIQTAFNYFYQVLGFGCKWAQIHFVSPCCSIFSKSLFVNSEPTFSLGV